MNEILDCAGSFAREISGVLGDNLLSVCLYGSAVLDDYRDGWSDIDLICFTKEPPLPQQAEKLLMLRQFLVERERLPMFRKIEGAVVSIDEFLNKQYSRVVYWGTSGQRITDSYCFDVFSAFELIRCGKTIFGDDVRSRMILPSYDELAAGVRQHYETIRKYAKETDNSVYSCGWLLDIARCLYTLRCGDIISKTAAGEWALAERLCPCESDLRMTLSVRRDPSAYLGLTKTDQWLQTLGPSVQAFADVLERELNTRHIPE